MYEKMRNLLENIADCIYERIHDAYWGTYFGGEEPSSEDIENLTMVESMLSIWERQHEEFISRQKQAEAEDNYYLQLESRLAGVRTRY